MDNRRFEGVRGIRCPPWCLDSIGKSRRDNVYSRSGYRSDYVGGLGMGRVNLDTGNFRQDPYGSLARVAPYAVTAHAKTEIPKEDDGSDLSESSKRDKEEADFSEIVRMLKAQGYKGYLSIEYEAAEDAMTAVPRFAQMLNSLGLDRSGEPASPVIT